MDQKPLKILIYNKKRNEYYILRLKRNNLFKFFADFLLKTYIL